MSCVLFELSAPAFHAYAGTLGLMPRQALAGLTRALATSLEASGEPTGSPLILIARGGDAPVFAWVGALDDSLRSSLEMQAPALEATCVHLRYLRYPGVEDACRRLAAALVTRLGRDTLARAGFAAIPNGGFVVLGLLASLLGLSRGQLETPGRTAGTEAPLVVVDDCAISGTRFHEFLASHRDRRIVFAPLVSPPALRAAIEAAEPCVIACVSGDDLGEIAGTVAADHQERRQERLARGACYWIGSTEPLGFPWNEPDRTLWNSSRQRYERAWWIVPPELCCKHRSAAAGTVSVQVQPAAHGPLQPAEQVLFGEIDGEVVLCSRAEGRVFRLGATGSALWRGLVDGGDLEAAVAAAAEEVDAPEAVLHTEARRFVEDLLARRLLTGPETGLRPRTE